MGFSGGAFVAMWPMLALLAAPAAAQSIGQVRIAHPQIDTAAMMRNVNTPSPTEWRPSQQEQDGPIATFLAYRDFLALGRTGEAYTMLHAGLQRLMSYPNFVDSVRDKLWPQSKIRLTRITWYPDLTGHGNGLHIAIDFAANADDGQFVCGYVVMEPQAGSLQGYAITREDVSKIPAQIIADETRARAVLTALPCWLGEDIITGLNPAG